MFVNVSSFMEGSGVSVFVIEWPVGPTFDLKLWDGAFKDGASHLQRGERDRRDFICVRLMRVRPLSVL
jgi:hypothetical protein